MKFVFSTIVAFVLLAMPAIGQNLPRVYIDAADTVDAGNSEHKAKQVDFGTALSAALVKKKTPVMVVTDESKAQLIIKSVSAQKEDSNAVKVTKIATGAIFGVGSGGFTKFEGTIQVIDIESSAILFAYNVKKGNFQSASEAFAKHFKNYLKKKNR